MSKKERFFGLHFDFHASNECEIGVRTDPEDIAWYITEAQPDFVQCDCKGHPGNSSYPTKVGKPADLLRSDNLRVWVDTVKSHDLPIFVHYSGVWDNEYLKEFPEDASIDEKGQKGNFISLYGNYAQKRLIPQIKELITEYGIDGAWIDGDCWAVFRDHSELAQPHLWENITPDEHARLMREAFYDYVRNYVNEIHSFAPDFQITSNWIYSGYSPDKPEIPVDFLSGDYAAVNSLHSARYEARCVAAQGLPWDLMAWAFEGAYHTDKPAVQLMQEAAAVLMLGGGFQMYITQNRDGSARKSRSPRIRQIGDFVRQRKLNFQKPTVAQVAVLHSADSYYKGARVFASWDFENNFYRSNVPLIGCLNALLDAQYTVNVVLEHQLDDLSAYEFVTVPEWLDISAENKAKLLSYARKGGNLVIMGAACCKQFGDLAGENFGDICTADTFLLNPDGCFYHVTEKNLLPLPQGEGTLYSNKDLRDTAGTAYHVASYGEGKILFIPFDLATSYHTSESYILSDYLKEVLSRVSVPLVELNREHIDLSLQKTDKGLLLNLLNMHQGRHDLKTGVFREIPPVCDVEILLHKPFRKVSMPLGEAFTYECGEDFVKIHLPRLDIHSIIQLENE